MRILLTGRRGQLGHAITNLLTEEGIEHHALDSSQLDLADADAIRQILADINPQLIINTAAYTAVDKAESEHAQAMAVNAGAPAVMADFLKSSGGVLIHYSTDYVFDGCASHPYVETDPTSPQSVYGQSKLMGEQAIQVSGIPHLIFRTSWVFGRYGHNFLLTMERLLRERDSLSVVDDQLGAPTSTNALADALLQVLQQADGNAEFFRQKSGLYHITCGGKTSWYGFAKRIAEALQAQGEKVAELKPIPTSDYPTPAKRPAYSVLDNTKLFETFGLRLPEWDAFFD